METFFHHSSTAPASGEREQRGSSAAPCRSGDVRFRALRCTADWEASDHSPKLASVPSRAKRTLRALSIGGGFQGSSQHRCLVGRLE